MKPTERFSNRVENYVKYRPHYPPEIISFLKQEIGLAPSSVIADIGSGTGISAELFLKNGNKVYGIEPNKEMREAGEKYLKDYSNFHSIEGTAEATTLENHSIDMIIAGQAFHWFDIQKTKTEFNRILKPEGWIVLMWNERILDGTPFLISYEHFLNTFGNDYSEVQQRNVKGNIDYLFKENGYRKKKFPNSQLFDFNGLQGRLLSSSYIPTAGSPKYLPMLDALRMIFDEHQIEGGIKILYDTDVYYGTLN